MGIIGGFGKWVGEVWEMVTGCIWVSTHHKRVPPSRQTSTISNAAHPPPSRGPTHARIHPMNNSPPIWHPTPWSNIHVGDILLLHNNDPIPADLLLLSSSEPGCLAYIETKNLDGETNLKIRKGPDETSWLKSPEDVLEGGVKGWVECEIPNNKLYDFRGNLVLEDEEPESDIQTSAERVLETRSYTAESPSPKSASNPSIDEKYLSQTSFEARADPPTSQPVSSHHLLPQKSVTPLPPTYHKIPLTISSILLRGSSLRNTPWIIALVLYTGPQTKIRLNAGQTPSKRSLLEVKMNNLIFINILLLCIMCIACSVGNPLWERKYARDNVRDVWYKWGVGPAWLYWTWEPEDELNVVWAGFVIFW